MSTSGSGGGGGGGGTSADIFTTYKENSNIAC